MPRLPSFTKGVVSPDVGLRLGRERQGVGRIDGQRVDWLAVDQPVQQVEDVRLGRHARLQRQFHGSQYSLLVMLKNESQNLDHLAVAARRLEHALLQSAEGRRQFGDDSCKKFQNESRAVASAMVCAWSSSPRSGSSFMRTLPLKVAAPAARAVAGGPFTPAVREAGLGARRLSGPPGSGRANLSVVA